MDSAPTQLEVNHGNNTLAPTSQAALLAPVAGPRSVSYGLDLVGNRTSVTENSLVTGYSPNLLNQYGGSVGSASIQNGSEHEVSDYQGVHYQYINDGRLTHVTSGGNVYDLKYDALGRTVSRTLNNQTTYFYYDGEKAILERGGQNASNIYGLGVDEIVVRFEADVYYFYQDHEGSVTHVSNNALANNSGILETYRYDAFGAPTIRSANNSQLTTSAIGNRFLFTGREWAPNNLGFYEYRARAYHPGLGRFLSEDPKGFDAGDYNLFRYCANDSMDKTDPMGLTPESFDQQKIKFEQNGKSGPDQATQQFYNAVIELLKSVGVRADAATVELAKTVGQSLANDAKEAAQNEGGNVRVDPSNGSRHGQEVGTGKYISKSGELQPGGVITSNIPADSKQYGQIPGPIKGNKDLANNGYPVTGTHSHGPGSGPGLQLHDRPAANDQAHAGQHPFIASVATTAERGARTYYFVPSANQSERASGRGGASFYSDNGGITFHAGGP